jgi:hypothetical protein
MTNIIATPQQIAAFRQVLIEILGVVKAIVVFRIQEQ